MTDRQQKRLTASRRAAGHELLSKIEWAFVASLDEQDLRACLAGIEALHSNYSDKWKVAQKLLADKSLSQFGPFYVKQNPRFTLYI